jgi:hypothetical protein
MSDRELAAMAAKGIRRGLGFWPNANHWCQGTTLKTGPDGETQRCTYQIISEGVGDGYSGACQARVTAMDEVVAVAKKRGLREYYSVCDVNNFNDFATVKSIVEEAAANLEKV